MPRVLATLFEVASAGHVRNANQAKLESCSIEGACPHTGQDSELRSVESVSYTNSGTFMEQLL